MLFRSDMLVSQAQAGSSTINMSSMLGNIHTILYFVKKDDPQGPYPSNPAADDQFDNWEWAVQAWKNNTYSTMLGTTTPSVGTTTTLNTPPVDTTVLENTH